MKTLLLMLYVIFIHFVIERPLMRISLFFNNRYAAVRNHLRGVAEVVKSLRNKGI